MATGVATTLYRFALCRILSATVRRANVVVYETDQLSTVNIVLSIALCLQHKRKCEDKGMNLPYSP